jgi:hypothetical protein
VAAAVAWQGRRPVVHGVHFTARIGSRRWLLELRWPEISADPARHAPCLIARRHPTGAARMHRLLAITLAATSLAACAQSPDDGDDEFAGIEISADAKADTAAAPTLMGALARNVPQTHSLVPVTSGYHLYTFDGTAGERIHLILESSAFRTYLRVTAPSGTRRSVSGTASGGAWRSAIDPWVLPETGRYQILAAAYTNMQTHPTAKARGAYTILARADNLPLTVAVSGSGTVTSTPAGINCGTTCTASYPTGTAVTLVATPAVSYHFIGWGGDCSGAGVCTLNMNAAHSVSASFALNTYNLSVATSGSGNVTGVGISCPGTCTTNLAYGSTVTLTATPFVGTHLVAWSGACAGSGVTCSLVMTSNRSVTATFAPNFYTVVVSKTDTVGNTGGGIIAGAISCPPGQVTCTASFPYGMSITLTAQGAQAGLNYFQFQGWSGACAGSAPTCTLVVTGNLDVGASFQFLIGLVEHVARTLAA